MGAPLVAQAGLVRLAKSPLPFCHCSETAGGGGLWGPLPKSLLPVWVLPQAAEAEVRSARDLLPRRTPQPSSYGTTPSEPHTQGAHDYFFSSFASQSPHTWAGLELFVPEGHVAQELPSRGGPTPRAAPPLPQRDLGKVVSPPSLSLPPCPISSSLGVCLVPAHGTAGATGAPQSANPPLFPPSFSHPRFQDDSRYHEDIFGVTLRTYEVTNRLRSESIAFIEESKKDTDE